MQETQETWVQSLGWEDPLEWDGNPLQYSCLKNSVDREAWQSTVHGGCKELDTTGQLSTHITSHMPKLLSQQGKYGDLFSFAYLEDLLSGLTVYGSFQN